MKKSLKKVLTLMSTLILTIFPAVPTMALNYGDFSSAVNGGFGSPSDLDLFLAGLWLIGLIITLFWAARISSQQRKKQVDEAYQRMVDMRNRPRTVSHSGVYIRPAPYHRPVAAKVLGTGQAASTARSSGAARTSGAYKGSGQLSGRSTGITRQVR